MLSSQQLKAAALARMKRVATALFIAMAVLFVTGLLLQQRWEPFSYLRAAAEGGMVGALADWFAVTALFRHPLGLKIPHTNLIQRKKDELGASLGSFVQENFLTAQVLGPKVRELRLPQRAGIYLASEAGARATGSQLSVTASGLLETLDDAPVLDLLRTLAEDYVVAPEWSTTLGTLGERLVTDGHHEALIDLLAERAEEWVRANPQVFTEVVAGRSPHWVPRMVDDLLASKLQNELANLLGAVRANRGHVLRLSIAGWLADFTRSMQHDPATIARVEAFKHSLLGDQALLELLGRGWQSLKAGLLASLADPDSPLRVALTQAVRATGRRLLTDRALAHNLQERLAGAATALANNHGEALVGLVSDTVAAWNPAETSHKLELQVGRDLQFIRINGTVIGALAGLGIHTAGQLILGVL
ncbi:DUF445 domain-containing protein [Glutamicibacter endophyticus]|uniref:DUF445 domain-containing protein n=1 Tax=Glutamicibacter endophyticus TaxID=1522174 RepID=UPI003AEFF9F0